MKRTITILTVLALSLILVVHVSAQNANTTAQVEFKAGTGPTSPVDPEDPGTDANGETEGSLAIVTVSNFNFGSQIPITTSQNLFDIQTLQPNIQIVDLRGTGAGYRVTASVSPFTDSGGETSLPGAEIHIYSARPNSLSESDPPVQEDGISLTTDGVPVPVITAEEGEGMGLWVMRWYPQEDTDPKLVQLEIPTGTATTGSHTAAINWVLEDAPSDQSGEE